MFSLFQWDCQWVPSKRILRKSGPVLPLSCNKFTSNSLLFTKLNTYYLPHTTDNLPPSSYHLPLTDINSTPLSDLSHQRTERAVQRIVKFRDGAFCSLSDARETSLLRRLQAQTLPDAAPPISKTQPFSKMAVTFEPIMQCWCPSIFRISNNFLTQSILWLEAPSPTILAWRHRKDIFTKDQWLNQSMK